MHKIANRAWHKRVIVRREVLWYFLGKFYAFVDRTHRVRLVVVSRERVYLRLRPL